MWLPFRVVFVCSGNTCRSPMAAALFQERLKEHASLRDGEVEVASAGLDAHEGEPAADGAVRALRSVNLSLEGHTATRFGEKHMDFDLILTMTEAHKTRILMAYPEVAAKVYTLKEYAGLDGSRDIADPFLQGDDVYLATMREIDEAVTKAAARLAAALAGRDNPKRGDSSP